MAIDSEAIRARGIIIVLVNPTSWSKISRIKKVKLVKVRLQSVCAPKSPHFSLLVGYNI